MVITVFGMGFVGLTTALGMAEFGHAVYGVEVDASRLNELKAAKVSFLEPGLEEALQRHLGKSFFPAGQGDGLEGMLNKSDLIFFCVGTPCSEDGTADLSDLFRAVGDALAKLDRSKFRALVIKSTVPPSTTMGKVAPCAERMGWSVGKEIGIANNPEFLREGHCWEDFIHPDRVVLGVSDGRSEQLLRAAYEPFHAPICSVTPNTGEYVKYLSNTLLATLVSYSNEMAMAAHRFGDIEIGRAFRILHLDKRWGNGGMASYVYPGCGYGGYCLPKDTKAFHALSRSLGCEMGILGEVIRTNESMAERVARHIDEKVQDRKAKLGILGLSFKPGSSDVRDTPSARVIQALLDMGYADMVAYDPCAMEEFQRHYKLPVSYAGSIDAVASRADALVILTAWEEFGEIGKRMDKMVIDCRYMSV